MILAVLKISDLIIRIGHHDDEDDESEGDGGKAEMVDGAPSCRQFGCVVGELGVARRRHLPLFLL